MGCGDLINPLHAIADSSGNHKLSIHINDDNICTIGRNILILKIISVPDFDPDSTGGISYVWDLWYNATWPQSTAERFRKDIRQLLDEPLPPKVFVPDCETKQKLDSIWKDWLCMVDSLSALDVLGDRYISY